MKQSTRFIIGSVVFILLFSVVAFKLQDNSLMLNATTLHEKLVQTTNDFKGLSLLNHLLLILILPAGIFWKKGRNILFVLFMIHLSGGVFISAFKHNIPSNYFYFPVVAGLIVYAAKTQKICFDFNTLSLRDKIIGSIALLGGFWYLALVENPVWVNATIYSPVGVVNCPTMLALCGFLILNSEQGNRSRILEYFVICGALFFGGLGLLTMHVYYDIILVAVALYMTWRLWKETCNSPKSIIYKLAQKQ
jgi:hypothetical protein